MKNITLQATRSKLDVTLTVLFQTTPQMNNIIRNKNKMSKIVKGFFAI